MAHRLSRPRLLPSRPDARLRSRGLLAVWNLLLSAAYPLWLCVWLLVAPANALANGHLQLPFSAGERLLDGWAVGESVSHPEFLRFTLVKGAQRVTLELVADPSPPGEWTTGQHRLQPGPGQQPDEALLRALMPALRRWDAARVQPALVPIGTSDPLAERDRAAAPVRHAVHSTTQLWAGAHLWLVAGALCWWRWSRRRERLALLAATPLLAGLAAWLLRWPISVDWLHLLHESNDALTALREPGKHAGPLPEVLRSLWPEHPVLWPGLAQAAHAQVWAVALASVLFCVWAARRLPVWAVACIVAGLALAPAWWRAVLSELPSAWVAVLVWGALAALSLWIEPETPRRWRLVSVCQLCLSALGLSATRPELGAAAFAILAATHPMPSAWLGRAVTALTRLCLRYRVEAVGGAAILAIVGLMCEAVLAGEAEWLAVSVNPVHRTTLDAVVAMAGALPLGWLLVTAAAVVQTPWHRWERATAWLAGSAVVLSIAKLYLSAAHFSWYETQRYLSMLAPFAAVLAASAAGWALTGLADRPLLRKATWLALCVPAVPLLATPLFPVQGDDPWPWQPLDRDRQLEARFVHDVVALAPTCALAARTLQVEPNSYRLRDRRWVLVRPDSPQLHTGDEGAGIAPLLAPGPAMRPPQCLIELRLLDCYRLGVNLCPAPQPSSQALLERRWTSRPYLDPNVHGAFERDLHLQAWRVDLSKLRSAAAQPAR